MSTPAVVRSQERSRAFVLSRSESELLAVSCACGGTLVSATRPGLTAQVATHWRLSHPEPIAITPREFVRRHAFPVGDDY